jgi:spore coat polysaccharide biosynthesis protein SpsF
MKRVVIVQARMGSTRLPGKVLMMIAGEPMLAQQLKRIKQCLLVDEIVIATTTKPIDDPIVELARHEDVTYFRGSETDVLGRFLGAAHKACAEMIVRITADCPLIDPDVVDSVIDELSIHSMNCDYASNILRRTYPHGLDVEAFWNDVLIRVHRIAHSQAAREHVTSFIYSERPDLFTCRSVEDTENNAHLRWTVDTAEDMQLIRTLYEALDLTSNIAPYRDVVSFLKMHPELNEINGHVKTWQPSRP